MTIECSALSPFEAGDLESVRSAFRAATPIALGQTWLEAAETDFAQANVRTGWRNDTLLVFAELSDHDVWSRARHHNERLWELGDTFEMFLQQEGSTNYVELHVSPDNLRLQLRFAEPPAPGANAFEAALIPEQVFESLTWVSPDARAWWVFAAVPAAALGLASATLAGARWRFSFSRYDYTHGRKHPVISSSSPHVIPAFHRPHEWGTLHFREGEA